MQRPDLSLLRRLWISIKEPDHISLLDTDLPIDSGAGDLAAPDQVIGVVPSQPEHLLHLLRRYHLGVIFKHANLSSLISTKGDH